MTDFCKGCGCLTYRYNRVGIDVLLPLPEIGLLDILGPDDPYPDPGFPRGIRVWCPNCQHLAPKYARPM